MTDLLDGARIRLSLHGVLVDPCLTPRRFTIMMITIRALHAVELILRAVNFIFTKQFVFGADRD